MLSSSVPLLLLILFRSLNGLGTAVLESTSLIEPQKQKIPFTTPLAGHESLYEPEIGHCEFI